MQGTTLKSLAKNPSLIPLYVCLFAGMIGSGGYLLRLATRNPDVSWSPKKKPEPWQDYKDKEYKLLQVHDRDTIDKVKVPEY